ncbi:MAG: DUF1775 domain-containing protein, partial [Acidobacteria bacterium]|nr:DUF1775 domain-containing protein [Acidobacteriota bacterium]
TVLSVLALLPKVAGAHITMRPEDPLKPGTFAAAVRMMVPNERHVPTTRIVLEIPEDFRKAGGRLSSVENPSGWEVKIEKQDKPAAIYNREMEARRSRRPARSEEERKEEEIRSEMLKQWITKVTFEGGSIPPDGNREFLLAFQLPNEAGKYYLPAVQVFEDGTEVSWSARVEGEGTERQAPSIVVESKYDLRLLALLGAVLVLLVLLLRPIQRYRQWRQVKANTPAAVRD